MFEKTFLKLKIWISCEKKIIKIVLHCIYSQLELPIGCTISQKLGLYNITFLKIYNKYEDDTQLILILLCLQCYVTNWGAVSHYWFKQQYLFRIIIFSIIIFSAQNVFNMYASRTKCINACNCRY